MADEAQRDDHDDPHLRPPPERRGVGIALALVAVAALGFALVSQRWLMSPSGNIGFGLRQTYQCTSSAELGETACAGRSTMALVEDWLASGSSFEAEHATVVFPWLGWITTALLATAIAGLLACAGAAALRRRPHWPVAPTTWALAPVLGALLTGCAFCATKPGEASFVGIAFGFWVFGAGVLCALLAAITLVPVLRPHDPDLAADAMNPDEF